ncbi:MAG: hypothetical protein ABIZ04_20885 [Opitutus sp.]
MSSPSRTTFHEIKKLERRILAELVNLYYDGALEHDQYHEKNGGIYEHKLATKIGFSVTRENRADPIFREACRRLESRGYVTLLDRQGGIAAKGVWPTHKGLEDCQLFCGPMPKRFWLTICRQWPSLTVSVITSVTTVMILRALHLTK